MSTSTGQAGVSGQRGSAGGRGSGSTGDTYGHPGGDPSSGQPGYSDGTGGMAVMVVVEAKVEELTHHLQETCRKWRKRWRWRKWRRFDCLSAGRTWG